MRPALVALLFTACSSPPPSGVVELGWSENLARQLAQLELRHGEAFALESPSTQCLPLSFGVEGARPFELELSGTLVTGESSTRTIALDAEGSPAWWSVRLSTCAPPCAFAPPELLGVELLDDATLAARVEARRAECRPYDLSLPSRAPRAFVEIPVCWASEGEDPADRERVRAAVTGSWGAAARARFVGWGACDEGSQLRLSFGSTVAASSARTSGGRGLRLDPGPYDVILPGPPGCATPDCVQGGAVHAVAHALGFVHRRALGCGHGPAPLAAEDDALFTLDGPLASCDARVPLLGDAERRAMVRLFGHPSLEGAPRAAYEELVGFPDFRRSGDALLISGTERLKLDVRARADLEGVRGRVTRVEALAPDDAHRKGWSAVDAAMTWSISLRNPRCPDTSGASSGNYPKVFIFHGGNYRELDAERGCVDQGGGITSFFLYFEPPYDRDFDAAVELGADASGGGVGYVFKGDRLMAFEYRLAGRPQPRYEAPIARDLPRFSLSRVDTAFVAGSGGARTLVLMDGELYAEYAIGRVSLDPLHVELIPLIERGSVYEDWVGVPF